MGKLDSPYGAAYLGICLSCILYGVTNLQTFLYFRTFPNDKLWDNIGILWLWFLDTLHVVFCVYMVYYYTITEFGNLFALLTVHWSLKAQLIVEALIIATAQTLYTIRIWRLDATMPRLADSRNPYGLVPGFVTFALLTAYSCVLVFCYEIPRQDHMEDFFEPSGKWITYYANINAAIVDAIIAIALCYLLASCRTGYKKTDSILGWLIFYIVNTGVVTFVCAVVCVIMLVALPNTMALIAAQVVQTKLYVNSYLALTNARTSLRARDPQQSTESAPASFILRPLARRTGPPVHKRAGGASVGDVKSEFFLEDRWSGDNSADGPVGVRHHQNMIYIDEGKHTEGAVPTETETEVSVGGAGEVEGVGCAKRGDGLVGFGMHL